MKYILLLFLICSYFNAQAQKNAAFVLYNNKGKKVKYAKLIREIKKQDIVLFGEFHNNPISHWMQIELAKELNKSSKLILGAEMLEADNQIVLNQYLEGSIKYNEFDTLARLWPNYETDYAPIVDFAKQEKIPFVATNIPRRFASMVLDSTLAHSV